MFLHIGKNIYIQKKDIVAILNAKTLNLEEENNFIEKILEFEEIRNDMNDDIKSYILICENRRNRQDRTLKKLYKLYASNISSTTLLKRFEDVETRLEV